MPSNLDDLLKSVSRSFYLSLRVLPSDVRPAMGLGYLLCRAADTVADTEVLAAGERLTLIGQIRSVFEVFPLSPDRGKALAEAIKTGLAGDKSPERELLERLNEAFDAFHRLSKTDQSLVQRVVVGVTKGMELDLRRFGVESERVTALENEAELERYLEWIGGEPGRFWTDLCAAHRASIRKPLERLKADGIRFGTGLQLINILRDLPVDLKNGRCYIPGDLLAGAGLSPDDLRDPANEERFRPIYHALIDSAIERLGSGRLYVEALPRRMFGLRAAVWWPLVIGLRTLALLRETPAVLGEETRVKVKRSDVYWLLLTSSATLPFNRLLRADFEDLAGAASSSTGLAPRRN